MIVRSGVGLPIGGFAVQMLGRCTFAVACPATSAGNRVVSTVAYDGDGDEYASWSLGERSVTQTCRSSLDGVSAEVLRQHSDARWKCILESSDGVAVIGFL